MIDLKAELFRKQEEYKQLKAQNSVDFVKGRKSEKVSKTTFKKLLIFNVELNSYRYINKGSCKMYYLLVERS